jgi:membrane associated rhomboid family serine protease
MFALFSFGEYIELSFENIFENKGRLMFVLMYFGAVATADLYNLFKQKNNPNYRSLGASGGVSAVVFSFVLLNPFGKIYLMFIPVGVPAFIFGGLYLVYCVYMAKRGGDNIGHIAHFTGSVFGFVFPILFQPKLLVMFFEQLLNVR